MKLYLALQLLGLLSMLAGGQIFQESFSQNATNDTGLLPIPELQPRDDTSESDDSNLGTFSEPERQPVTDRIAAQIEFEPNDEILLDDYYAVSNFAFNTLETSELCPTGSCEFDLEGGQLDPEFTPGERIFTGKLSVDTGESRRIMNLFSSWETVEERANEDGDTIQYIEGTLGIGRDEFNPDYEYRINGTMTSDGENYLVALHGER
jgi:hypothetical protein